LLDSIRTAATLVILVTFTSCASAPATPFLNPSHEALHFGNGPAITYVVMGDSTVAGQGAPYEEGIAIGTARHLGTNHGVTMTNLGISGARAADVVREQLAEARRLHPDLVLLSLGANDVTHLTPIGSQRHDADAIIDGLRESNPKMAIVVTGSPDMSSAPRIPWLLRGIAGSRTRAVNKMYQALVARKQLVFAPIAAETGPRFRADRALFAPDRFHPNAAGYAIWLPVLDRALNTAIAR
jgi:acyl-CoA thioesterase-1